MSPYLREEDIPEPACEGSFVELNWEGAWDDPTRPTEIVCPVCGVKLKPEYEQYEIDGKKGIFFIAMPIHYPEKRPNPYARSSRDDRLKVLIRGGK